MFVRYCSPYAHHSSWYSSSTDSRGTMLESMVSGSNFCILNWDSPTRLPGNDNPSSPDVSLASASLITSTNWQTKTNLETILRAIILKAASHHIPSGRHRINTESVPTEIWEKRRARDDLRSRLYLARPARDKR